MLIDYKCICLKCGGKTWVISSSGITCDKCKRYLPVKMELTKTQHGINLLTVHNIPLK
jgi:hypothetical protein